MFHPRWTILNRTRYIVATLCMLLSTITLWAQESSHRGVEATIYEGVPDSLRRTYRHSEAVQRLAIHRDTTAARAIWQEIIEKDGDYAPALYHLSLTSRTNSSEALEYARRAYVADSTNKWYVQNYGTKLFSSSNYDEALPVYRRLLKLDKQDISIYYSLAHLYRIKQMHYSAISILDSADMRLGRNSHTSALKQRLLFETRQYDRAIEEGRRTIIEIPYDIDAHVSLAYAYEASGRDSMALQTLEQALAIDSTSVSTLEMLSSWHARRGNVQQMLEYDAQLFASDDMPVEEKLLYLSSYTGDTQFYISNFVGVGRLINTLALRYPTNRDVIEFYAMHLLVAGDKQQALDYLRRHLQDDGVRAVDYMSVMQLELQLDAQEALNEDIAEALRRYPNDFAIISFVGYIYVEKGLWSEAIAMFKESIDVAQNDEQISSAWGYIGDTYHEAGNDKRAFAAYDKALRYNSDNMLVLNNYAYFLSLTGRNLERALTMSQRALYLAPDNYSYIDTHAWVLHCLGRDDEAKVLMRQALSLSSQRDPDILAHYGDILWALGEHFLAETYWEKAVDNGYDAELMEEHRAKLTK